LIASASRSSVETFKLLFPLNVRAIVPDITNWSNYSQLLAGPFSHALYSSALVAGLTVVIGLPMCASGAFALGVIPMQGQKVIFAIIVIGFLIPYDALAIPLFRLFFSWNLQDSYIGLILPALGSGFALFILRQFFLNIPKSLIRAARVDGASWFRIFLDIVLPLSRPALVGAGLLLFTAQWHAYLWPLLIAPDQAHILAPIALGNALNVQQDVPNFGFLFAGSVILAIIPAAILFAFQRQFVHSIDRTGLK
jgi:ABC-type glycerol-3-phosphate transport system permease component